MDDFIPHTSWIRDIPDSAPLMALSIPGAHNSCCVDGAFGLAETGEGNKFDVAVHIEEALCGDSADLYITFSGAFHLTARDYAETINLRLNDYLAGSSQGRVRIVVMDHFEEPQELVSNMIKTNFATGATGGDG